MAIDTYSSVQPYPPFESKAIDALLDGAEVYTSIDEPCPAHHPERPNGFSPLQYVAFSDALSFHNINSLKWTIKSLSDGFMRPLTGHGKIYSVPPSFNNRTVNEKILLSDWNQIRNTLVQFEAATGSGLNLPTIDANTTIQSTFFNQIKDYYDYYKGLCLCNSDCSCNMVCTCNTDCGCNYSDVRLKKNVEHIRDLNIGEKVIGYYSFEYIQDGVLDLPKGKQLGVMAQELINLGLGKYVCKYGHFYKVDYHGLYEEMECTILE